MYLKASRYIAILLSCSCNRFQPQDLFESIEMIVICNCKNSTPKSPISLTVSNQWCYKLTFQQQYKTSTGNNRYKGNTSIWSMMYLILTEVDTRLLPVVGSSCKRHIITALTVPSLNTEAEDTMSQNLIASENET